MKKFMFAFAVVAMAISAQAATVSWSCTLVKDGKGDSSGSASGIAYLMLTSDVADFTALAGKGKAAVTAALGDALISYTPSSAGNYGHAAVDNATLNLSDSTAYGNAYLVVFDTTTVTEASKFYVSNTKSLTTLTEAGNASLSFGSQSTASKNAANWHAVAAPEPTSGLLLLLGMAGLALKRKRV